MVEQALAEGHEVTAFAREPSRLGISHERLRVVRGDVTDPAAVEEAVAGQDAVLSALGHAEGSKGDVLTRGAENVVGAMERHGVRRLVSLTGAGIRDPRDRPKLVDRVITTLLKVLQGDLLRDSERHVEVIRESRLDWVIVRGPRLTDDEKRGEYRIGYIGKNSGTKISRSDVADFMLRQLEGNEYLGRMPVVSY